MAGEMPKAPVDAPRTCIQDGTTKHKTGPGAKRTLDHAPLACAPCQCWLARAHTHTSRRHRALRNAPMRAAGHHSHHKAGAQRTWLVLSVSVILLVSWPVVLSRCHDAGRGMSDGLAPAGAHPAHGSGLLCVGCLPSLAISALCTTSSVCRMKLKLTICRLRNG